MMIKDDKFIKFLKETIQMLAVSFLLLFVFTQFLIFPFRVDGESMYPSLSNDEYGISNVLGSHLKQYKRFDVVIVYVEATNKNIVKRIIGMPGETIQYQGNLLLINNEVIEESFLDVAYVDMMTDDGAVNFTHDFGPVVLGADEYFLLGDNRPRSSDSRNYGAFKENQIISKNAFILFPFQKMRFVGGE